MKKFTSLLFLIFHYSLFSQQIADNTYHPPILHPIYEAGKGSIVFIDQGHHNFHTKSGRYKPFANLLEKDGYTVNEYKGSFKEKELAKGKILVIANALNELNANDWYLPVPSAFNKSEIEIVEQWVFNGGSLFLIADHMPCAGAATELAAKFGFVFTNGFVMDTNSKGPALFDLKEKTLFESSITKGRDSTESVKQIASFTGQGFTLPDDATSILIFNDKYINMLPDTAFVFNKQTTRYNAKGLSQGAYKKYGKGKIVVFGEAGMFTAQIAGPEKYKMGMNNKDASENYKLLLNIIHWLDGKLE